MDGFKLSVGGWLSVVGFRWGTFSTLRRRAQSMRRISIASAASGRPTVRANRSHSIASCSWYSISPVDLMLISRKRANSLELVEPQPSTMLHATDSAALTICDLSDPFSRRGKPFTARRTPSTSSWALCQTNNRRKSCMPLLLSNPRNVGRQICANLADSFLPLKTTDNWPTDQLTTPNLDTLSRTLDSPSLNSAEPR